MRTHGDVRKLAAGGRSRVVNGAQVAVEERAPAVLGPHDLVSRVSGLRIDVFLHYLLHWDSEMHRDRLDLGWGHLDNHSPAAVRALGAVELPLDFVSHNLEGLDGNVVGMEVASEVEILRFLRFGQAADLVWIGDQTSR